MTRAVRTFIASWIAAVALGSGIHAARAQDDDLDLGEDEAEVGASDDTAEGEEQSEEEGAVEAEGGDTEATPADAEPPEPVAPPAPGVEIQVYAGAGATSRSFERPIDGGGTQRLAPSLVPAVEVGLRVIAWPSDAFSLTSELHYQSAVGLTVTQFPPFALEEDISVRSERVELSVAPTWRLGSGSRSARLLVPVGLQIRTLWPETHGLLTRNEIVPPPGYTLLGPHARIELVAPLGGPVSVRLGPEVQWIMAIDEALRQNGLARMGVALGGEVALQAALDTTWAIALLYRESHALVSGSAASFEDVERYMTARMQGAF